MGSDFLQWLKMIQTTIQTEVFDLIEQAPNLLNMLTNADPLLFNCRNKLEIATRLLPIIYKMTLFPYGDRETTNVDHNQVSAQEYYEKVIRNYKPVLCGGINTFFYKILNEYFGIDSCLINMGIPFTPNTHVVTLISIKDCDRYIFYIFDSHYGCYFKDESGNHLDLESIFNETPFTLTHLDLEKKFIFDTSKKLPEGVDNEIENGKASFIRQMDETRFLYHYSPLDSTFKSNYFLLTEKHQFQHCSWRQTCVLQYLDFGQLFGLKSTSKPICDSFLQMLQRYKIETSNEYSLFDQIEQEPYPIN